MLKTQDSDQDRTETTAHADCAPYPDNTRRDLGRMALFISLLGVILVAIFFFAVNQNIMGVASDVESLKTISARLETTETRLEAMEEKMATLDGLPAQARRMVLASMLQDMAQRAAFLGGEAESEEQAAKLQQARLLLEEVQADMSR